MLELPVKSEALLDLWCSLTSTVNFASHVTFIKHHFLICITVSNHWRFIIIQISASKTGANLVSQLKIPAWPKICIQLLIKSSGRNYFLHWDTAFCSTEQISVSLLALFPQTQPGVLVQHVPACCVRAATTNHSQPGSRLTGVEIHEAWVGGSNRVAGKISALALGKPLSEVGIAATPLEEFIGVGNFSCLAIIGPAADCSESRSRHMAVIRLLSRREEADKFKSGDRVIENKLQIFSSLSTSLTWQARWNILHIPQTQVIYPCGKEDWESVGKSGGGTKIIINYKLL